jgi:ATP-dependent DNA helicase RecQ
LGLSAAARPVLTGKTEVILGLPRDAVETVEKGKKRAGGRKDYDQALFDALRATRKRLADAAGVPPFVVFSDATLAEMARTRPGDSRTMLQVSGVGEHKLRQYGKTFLEVISAYRQEGPEAVVASLSDKDLALTLSDTQKETLRLYREDLDLPGISSRRGLKDSTVAVHLEELHALGADIDLLRFVDEDKIPLIRARLEKLGPVGLADLKEGLPVSISYEDIRLVRGAKV